MAEKRRRALAPTDNTGNALFVVTLMSRAFSFTCDDHGNERSAS